MLQRMQKLVGCLTLEGWNPGNPVTTETFVDCVYRFHLEGSISALQREIPTLIPGVSEHREVL